MKLYCCYSINLRDFLYSKGFRYELAECNPNNGRLHWVYIITPELSKALDEWSNRK